MRTLPSLFLLTLAGLCLAPRVDAQGVADSARCAPGARSWTAQEIHDMCAHKRGARMRLYGCTPEAFGRPRGEPLYLIDGAALPTDTIGPRRLAREATIRALRATDIEAITSLVPDSAVTRYGRTARFGAILIRTKRPTRRDSAHGRG